MSVLETAHKIFFPNLEVETENETFDINKKPIFLCTMIEQMLYNDTRSICSLSISFFSSNTISKGNQQIL